jgi:protein-S-isoprenylcysteine O-methyltransferase Ste14
MYENNETKHWWQSRTIWVQLVAILFAVGARFEWWPTWIEQDDAIAFCMALVGIVTLVLRIRTKKEIKSAPVIATIKGSSGTIE